MEKYGAVQCIHCTSTNVSLMSSEVINAQKTRNTDELEKLAGDRAEEADTQIDIYKCNEETCRNKFSVVQ
mgnify:CR=1 FL=1